MISRRELLALLLMGVLPSSKFACAADTDQSSVYDLIIIGGGIAGLTAACVARENGLDKILLLEKEPILGGSSVLSIGTWAVVGTSYQKEHGVTDDNPRLFFENIMKAGGYRNDPKVVQAYIDNSLRHYEWVCGLGVQPYELYQSSGLNHRRGHRFNMPQLVQRLHRLTLKRNVQIKLGTRAESLLTDSSGTVRAVVANVCNSKEIYLATKGILIATGGFSRSDALIRQYAPHLQHIIKIAGEGTEGDGISMAVALGAQLADMDNLQALYGATMNASSGIENTQVFYAGAIIVNNQGFRFVDESKSGKQIGDEALKQTDQESFIVFDERIRQSQMHRRIIDHKLLSMDEQGFPPSHLYRANSMEELAKKMHVSPTNLLWTVQRYNEFVSKQRDEDFGRVSLSGGQGRLVSIENSPFYAMPATLSMMVNNCGIRIDEKARVINRQGKPIPHLYAAGEVTGGFHGKSSIGATQVGVAMVFARLAAENIAKEKPLKIQHDSLVK